MGMFSKHAKRDHSGLLDPSRNPNPITDTHRTESAPKTGQHSGDGMKGGKGTAGAK